MVYWKLGCNWGGEAPSFLEFIQEHKIVIGTEGDMYGVGDVILIMEGFQGKALGIIKEKPVQVTSNAEFEEPFEKYQIPFESWINYSSVEWIDLKEEDSIYYKLQAGIRKIQKEEVINYINRILLEQEGIKNTKGIARLLESKKQIILQGPPGTGKTYTAKDIAEQIIFSDITMDKAKQKQRLEESEQFKLIQFHPAYSYEDFVRGIVAKSKDNAIEYIAENKPFAKFASDANKNFINSAKAPAEYSKEQWFAECFEQFCEEFIQGKINEDGGYELTKNVSITEVEENAFRYKGEWASSNGGRMRFKDLQQAYLDGNVERQDIKNNKMLSRTAFQHASYFRMVLDAFRGFLKEKGLEFKPKSKEDNIVQKKYVFIIDEINRANLPAVLGELIYGLEYRGEKVDSMYAVDEEHGIVIPPNLYIIGTMNTSDRSVGYIDYAIRRRFAFVDVLPQILKIENFQVDAFKAVSSLFISNFDDYALGSGVILNRSEHLSEEFRPEDVWLGHSYFISNNDAFSLRKQYEIIPILKEYIKDGILKQSAVDIINAL